MRIYIEAQIQRPICRETLGAFKSWPRQHTASPSWSADLKERALLVFGPSNCRMIESGNYLHFDEENWDQFFINPPDCSVDDHERFLEATEWPSCWNDFIDDDPIPSFFTATDEDLMVVDLPNDCQDTTQECRPPDHVVLGQPRDESCLPNFGTNVLASDSAQSITNTNCTHSTTQSFDTVEDLFACSSDDEYKGLRLVHLLVACAEAISKEAHDLVDILLCRLRYLVCPTGTTVERVAYYLFHSLQSYCYSDGRLNNLDFAPPNAQHHFLGAFRLLHQVYPYIRIAHFTANQSILEAVLGTGNNFYSRSIHIIDFDIMEGLQWPPLMEAIVNADIEIDHLRITAIKWDTNYDSLLFSSCRDTGKRLLEYANSVGIPFSFDEMDLKSMNDCVKENQDDLEIVVVNCMWQLPHMSARSKSQVAEFFHGAGQLHPHILTFGTGPHGAETADFIKRFSHCLQSFCAVVDSLEAGLPEHGLARAMVERIFFAPKICTMIVQADDNEYKFNGDFHDFPLKCGFAGGLISKENMMHANAALLTSEEGRYYGVELVGDHQLNLKWGSTPLVRVSVWETPV
eukprot:Gb_26659 [translate_table: standard]